MLTQHAGQDKLKYILAYRSASFLQQLILAVFTGRLLAVRIRETYLYLNGQYFYDFKSFCDERSSHVTMDVLVYLWK